MVYPTAPWQLQGQALVALQPVEIDRVRSLVPPCLQIVSIFPGKTLGGIYIASYDSGSTLRYSELIVISALTYYAGKVAPWISHIYVDCADSVQGGREIWGLPKEMAQFTWKSSELPSVQVSQDGQLLCSCNGRWQTPGVPVPISGAVFSMLDDMMMFSSHGRAELHWMNADLQIPPESTIGSLSFGQNWLAFHATDLTLTINAPLPI